MLAVTEVWPSAVQSAWISPRDHAGKAITTRVSLDWKPHRGSNETNRRPLQLRRCSENSEGEVGKNEGDENTWAIEGKVEKLLSDEALFQDLTAAVERVTKARKDLDELEEREKQSLVAKNLDAAKSLVESCQRDVFAAEMDVKNAEIALIKARAGIVDTVGEEIIDKDVERKESAKAAGVAGVVGSLAVIPFYSLTGDLDNVEIILKTGMALISCALFGLTYRYVVRRDLINTQLRAGCIAAFALVRCFAQVDAARLLSNISQKEITELLSTGSLFAAESIAIFSFAAVGLEYCMQQGIVSPFPSKRQ